MNNQPTEDFIKRRIEFLLQEANQECPRRDLAVTYTFRAIFNHYAIGNPNASSNQLKAGCRYRSQRAHVILEAGLRDPVICEHEMPIEYIWTWMCNERGLRWKDVDDKIRQWPVVIVTQEEDRRLRGNPAQRYNDAGIVVLHRDANGAWSPRPPRD